MKRQNNPALDDEVRKLFFDVWGHWPSAANVVDIDHHRCAGYNANGTQCNIRSRDGHRTCLKHKDQEAPK